MLHGVYDDAPHLCGKLCEGEDHLIYAQCLGCSQISPFYPTIEKLKEAWQALAQEGCFAMPDCPKCGGVVLVVHEDCNGDPKGYRAACTKECPHMFAYGRTPQIALQGFFESTAYARGGGKPERVQTQ